MSRLGSATELHFGEESRKGLAVSRSKLKRRRLGDGLRRTLRSTFRQGGVSLLPKRFSTPIMRLSRRLTASRRPSKASSSRDMRSRRPANVAVQAPQEPDDDDGRHEGGDRVLTHGGSPRLHAEFNTPVLRLPVLCARARTRPLSRPPEYGTQALPSSRPCSSCLPSLMDPPRSDLPFERASRHDEFRHV